MDKYHKCTHTTCTLSVSAINFQIKTYIGTTNALVSQVAKLSEMDSIARPKSAVSELVGLDRYSVNNINTLKL